jgi:putative ABC transport system substrate-binding protein
MKAAGRYYLLLVNLLVLLIVFVLPAIAQHPTKVPRIGYLAGTRAPTRDAPDANRDAFRQALRDLGYIEGKNILVEYRYTEAKPDRVPGLVAELVRLNVEAIVSPDRPSIRAAGQATKTIPIIMVTQGDPIADGFVESLARPGGNITGVTRLIRELGKRLELFKEIVPTVSRIGILVPDTPAAHSSYKDYQTPARALKLELQAIDVRSSSSDFEEVFRTKERVEALIILRNPLLINNRKRIAELAIQKRMPSMSEGGVFVQAGSLLSYSSDENDSFTRAAYYVDKILKGAKPADLPVEQPTKFELVINLKTAKQIGLTIPPNVLARADKVIR